MTPVLVVDDDALFARSLMRLLEQAGLAPQYVSTPRDALELLASERVEIMLTDLDMGAAELTGLELIRRAREQSPETRAILMSGIATARDYKAAMQAGAVEVLVKPFSPDELKEAVGRALSSAEGFRGDVHGVELVEVLQLYHFSRKPVAIQVQGVIPGEIFMRGGDIVGAQCGGELGEPALRQILARRSGTIHTSVLEQIEPSIDRRFDQVLMDAIRQIDEDGREPDALAEDPFELDFGLEDEFADFDPINLGEEQTMGKIDDSCKQVVDNTDGGIACGVVDLDTGMLLGIHNNAQYSQSLNEIVAAAAVDMFRGGNVGRIEKAVRSHRGVPEDGSHYIEEVQFSSANNYHFCKSLKNGRAVIILVTNKTTSIGMGWASLKSVIGDVEPLVP